MHIPHHSKTLNDSKVQDVEEDPCFIRTDAYK